ncbi:response regulator transcription factor [Streptacidiphilus sp. PAMC 29251]
MAAEAALAAAAAWNRAGHHRRAEASTRRAKARAARCQGAETPALAFGDVATPLTAREQEVALLAGAGNPSKDIAAALSMSVRTVNNHLQHIYNKLGVRTRRDLAAALSLPPESL